MVQSPLPAASEHPVGRLGKQGGCGGQDMAKCHGCKVNAGWERLPFWDFSESDKDGNFTPVCNQRVLEQPTGTDRVLSCPKQEGEA